MIQRLSQRQSREMETSSPRMEIHTGRDIHLHGWSQRKRDRKRPTWIQER